MTRRWVVVCCAVGEGERRSAPRSCFEREEAPSDCVTTAGGGDPPPGLLWGMYDSTSFCEHHHCPVWQMAYHSFEARASNRPWQSLSHFLPTNSFHAVHQEPTAPAVWCLRAMVQGSSLVELLQDKLSWRQFVDYKTSLTTNPDPMWGCGGN